jgi:hypothetical protein
MKLSRTASILIGVLLDIDAVVAAVSTRSVGSYGDDPRHSLVPLVLVAGNPPRRGI